MRKPLFITFTFLFFAAGTFAQIAPYSISPKWVFGDKVMLDFTGGAPTQVTRTDNLVAYEGASTLCDSSGALMVYTNNVRLAGANFTPLISPNIMTGSSSSTQGGVIIPDPNNIDAGFYVLVGNAESNYSTEPNDIVKNGVKVYRGSKSGSSVTINNTPTNLFTNATLPTENAFVSSNGAYGYRLINFTVNGSGASIISTREVTNGGIAGSSVTSSITSPANWNLQYQSSIKVSRCQNRIAFATGATLIVANYDRSTGTVGSVIYSGTPALGTGGKFYGVEFSPNGNYLFFTTLDKGNLGSVNLSTGVVTNLTTNTSGTLQVAPDGNIYLANGIDGAFNTTGIAVITNPNTGGTYSASGVTYSGTKQTKLGLTNQAWLNPRRPVGGAKLRNGTSNCREYTFGFRFYTHFNDKIALTSTTWEFTDNTTGIVTTKSLSSPFTDSTNYILPTSNAFNVKVTVVDQVCGETWVSNTFTVAPSCPAPVELLYLKVKNDNNINFLEWATIQEENSAYFNVLRSENGVFKKIGSVSSNGNSNSLVKYSFEDQGEFIGNVYYQLEQVDLDGSVELSNIVATKSDQIKFVIAPNPSSNEFYLSFDEENIQSVSIFNLEGRKVEQHDFPTRGMSFGKELTTGTYLVKVSIGDQVFVKKILKW